MHFPRDFYCGMLVLQDPKLEVARINPVAGPVCSPRYKSSVSMVSGNESC